MSTLAIKILIGALLVSLALVFYFQSVQTQRSQKQVGSDNNAPRSVFHRIDMTLLSTDNTQYFLQAQQVSRLDDGHDQFIAPDLQFTQGRTDWQIRSQHATSRQKAFVQFDKDVSIKRHHQDGTSEVLESQQFYLDLQHRQLSSSVPVDYRAANIHVTANSMTLLLDSEHLLLSGGVRGEYAAP